MIKEFFCKTLFRSRFHVGFSENRDWIRKYFWRFKSARKFADSQPDKATVWSRNWKPVYISNNRINFSMHPDSNNFSINI